MAAVAGTLAFPAAAARDDLILVSRATGGAIADADSDEPSVSGDGRFVAFYSLADNLSPDDNANYSDIFVRDLRDASTALVSRATGAGGAGANDRSTNPAISANGRFVAFASDADNLSMGDNNSFANVFVRDLQENTTTLASVTFNNAAGANDNARAPSISADGRFVAFESGADNLTTDDNDSFTNIFVRDLHPKARTTTLISVTFDNAAGGNADSFSPALSGDGRFVAFYSNANNLSPEDNDAVTNVFVRDRVARTTTLVSRASGPAGAPATESSDSPAISADGRFVAFASSADNLSAEDGNVFVNVFVRDLVANTTTLVSRAAGQAGAGADGSSSGPAISADGRLVAFRSDGDNLSADDNNDFPNVFVRDLVAGTTTLVSRGPGPNGAPADNRSGSPAIAGVGRFVVFDSESNNISAEDDNDLVNVFARDVFGPVPGSPFDPAVPGPGGRGGANTRCAGRRATLLGTPRRDVLRGTAGRDVIVALAGNDLVVGRGGADLICLGRGRDRGRGGGGSDLIDGGPGNDRLLGGLARDRLLGRAGRDILIGGLGRDRLLGGAGRNRLVGGAGRDACRGGTARLCEVTRP